MTNAEKEKNGDWGWRLKRYVVPSVQGTLSALRDDIVGGVAGDIAMRGSGEVLGDMLALARDAVANGGEGQKNVEAVLVAAAFEDTVRRPGSAKAQVIDRPKLEDVIGRLKLTGVLAGAGLSTASGYLKFRNDALHADWSRIDAATIQSCLAFVEGLLLYYFS